jgi:hypothetical protein
MYVYVSASTKPMIAMASGRPLGTRFTVTRNTSESTATKIAKTTGTSTGITVASSGENRASSCI